MERNKKQDAWNDVARQMGPRHAGATLKGWEFSEDPDAAKAQRENIEKLQGYISDFEANIAEGVNIIWSGTRGTGKDHQMSACLRVATGGFGIKARWMYGANLFLGLRGLMSKTAKETEEDFIRDLCKVPVLAISDPLPATGELSSFEAKALLTIVDERYRHRRPIFTTLNIESRTDAEARLGGLTVDRLFEGSLILYSSWPSYRQRKQVRDLEAE